MHQSFDGAMNIMTSNASQSMKCIMLGCYLDGQSTTVPVDRLGAAVLGPLALLDILETQLGLLALHPSTAERVIQYRNCLALLDNPSRFYHRSFALDPLGTAALLLAWRDEWDLRSCGEVQWEEALSEEAPARIRDMAAVEQCARASVSPNLGQRLQAVLVALKSRKTDIETIEVIDPIDILPRRWQSVLSALPLVQRITPCEANGESLEDGKASFLGALRHALKQVVAGNRPDPLSWQDDGSVIVVQAETRALAAHWVAGHLGGPDALLVSSDEGARLDAHLAALGQARLGLREVSAFRPALQVLPLVTELLWKPLNYHALVQFLTHPIGPLPRFARQRLAVKVANAPGIGGDKWQQALADIARHYGPERAAHITALISYWVEHPRFDANAGAPLAAVAERVARLVEFFRLQLGEVDEARRLAFIAGLEQCQACLDALALLQAQGSTTISPRQLQKLVARASGHGMHNPLWPAEVGSAKLATQPGAVIEPVERVIWWQMVMPTLPGASQWSDAEVRALLAAGVDLPDAEAQFDEIARTWLRPVMAARKQLILVLPPAGEEVHPLWQMISNVVDAPIVSALEALICSGGERMHALSPVALPPRKRWWQLPADISITQRERESFSSLEQLLFNPYQWLLRYPAALRPSKLVSVGGDFLLFGNLAHALIERYFRHDDGVSMNESAFEVWFAAAFETLIDQEGALLRMPGRGADLANFRLRLFRALQSLRQHFHQARVIKVVPEQALEGRFDGGELAGFADLVTHTMGGDSAIVDLKWSGAKKYPEKLRHNRHLQLAIYAELLRQQSGMWPSVAFYLLDRARLLAPDDRSFPEAECIPSEDGENTAQLWQRFLSSWHWRTAQVRAGQFEVVQDGIEPTDDSIPPQDALTPEVLNAAYNDYRALAGWAE